jgi:hypothetical protein
MAEAKGLYDDIGQSLFPREYDAFTFKVRDAGRRRWGDVHATPEHGRAPHGCRRVMVACWEAGRGWRPNVHGPPGRPGALRGVRGHGDDATVGDAGFVSTPASVSGHAAVRTLAPKMVRMRWWRGCVVALRTHVYHSWPYRRPCQSSAPCRYHHGGAAPRQSPHRVGPRLGLGGGRRVCCDMDGVSPPPYLRPSALPHAGESRQEEILVTTGDASSSGHAPAAVGGRRGDIVR